MKIIFIHNISYYSLYSVLYEYKLVKSHVPPCLKNKETDF